MFVMVLNTWMMNIFLMCNLPLLLPVPVHKEPAKFI